MLERNSCRYITSTTDITEIEASEGQEIRISPIVLDYGYMGKIQYKYRLNPDSVWIPLAEREPIVLNGLKNGEYLLEVQYTDSKGIWSAEITTLSIDINPPFKRKMLYPDSPSYYLYRSVWSFITGKGGGR